MDLAKLKSALTKAQDDLKAAKAKGQDELLGREHGLSAATKKLIGELTVDVEALTAAVANEQARIIAETQAEDDANKAAAEEVRLAELKQRREDAGDHAAYLEQLIIETAEMMRKVLDLCNEKEVGPKKSLTHHAMKHAFHRNLGTRLAMDLGLAMVGGTESRKTKTLAEMLGLPDPGPIDFVPGAETEDDHG